MSRPIVVFEPRPLVTVTIEDRGSEPDLHVHAGGQGVWQSRMISTLGVPVVLCAALGGETGALLRHLLDAEGVHTEIVEATARNGGYVHDRRDRSERRPVVEAPGDPLDRHELDNLYERTLTTALGAGYALLSGPQDHAIVPADVYRRLTADLTANGCRVIADLSGDLLDAVVEAGPYLVKVSHEELVDDGRAASDEPEALVKAMHGLRTASDGTVIVSRGEEPALVLLDDEVLQIRVPPIEAADSRGAGDSMTAGIAATLAKGESLQAALRVGAACGALNVARHGLGTAGADGVRVLAERVELCRWDGDTT
jgi:1-phosphofructokinase